MCVLRPRLAALSFMLNKSGAQAGFERCSGLPAALKEEFVRESTKCPREVIIPTPVSKLYEHISLGGKYNCQNYDCGPERWLGMKHIVDKQSNQLCVSKQMVKTCSLQKRALSGESLLQEISQLPTVFRREELEAGACSSDYGYPW